MNILLEIVYWACVLWLLTVFVLYPLTVAVIARLRPRPIRRDESLLLPVTFVMAAYNEEAIIGRRLRNYQELDYPREMLRFLIGSDASTDRTDEIIRSYAQADSSIELRRFERSGKTKIVYTMAGEVSEGLIIFSDADVVMEPDSLRRIVSCFGDPEVGGVVVQVDYQEDEENAGSIGERNYHGAEDRLRRNESLAGSTIRPTGQCFAVRPGAYTPLQDMRMSDDLNLAITIALNGYRVWFEPDAVITEVNRRTLRSEISRRLRMGQQSMATYRRYEGTRWPWRSATGLKLWLNKLSRNMAGIPFFLAILLGPVLALMDAGTVYGISAIGTAIWTFLVLTGWLADRFGLRLPGLAYPLYFTAMVGALTIGSIRALTRGGGLAMWTSPRINGSD